MRTSRNEKEEEEEEEEEEKKRKTRDALLKCYASHRIKKFCELIKMMNRINILIQLKQPP